MRIWLVTLLLWLAACSESFAPASLVTDFRVVNAKVTVDGAPERASPSPEDGVEVSLLAIDRGADGSSGPALTPGPLQWAFVPCVPLPVTIGTPICGDAIEPCEGCIAAPPMDPLALPVMRFSVPADEDLEAADATSVLLQGVVCSNGRPSEDAILDFILGETDDLVPCEGPPIIERVPIEGRFVTVSIPIEDDVSDPNLHPVLDLNQLFLDGRAWPPPYDEGVPRDAPRTGCLSDLEGLSQAARMAHPRAGEPPSSINLAVTRGSLQTFMVDDQEVTEEIQVSWLADAGGFERTFSFITNPDARSVLTRWQASQGAPEDGLLVRFNFVIRDGRGGSDSVDRGLCILPSAAE